MCWLQDVAGDGSSSTSVLREEDVIPNTPSLITVSSRGFIKRMPTTEWEAQKRGGKGG